jgi:hypothetical protein
MLVYNPRKFCEDKVAKNHYEGSIYPTDEFGNSVSK